MTKRSDWVKPELYHLDVNRSLGGTLPYPKETDILLVDGVIINSGRS